MSTWQLQQAKARFSEIVRAAESRPQFITLRGRKKAVILSYDLFAWLYKIAENACAAEAGALKEKEKD